MGGQGSVAQGVIEEKVDNLLACIQPNGPSELRRHTIASYVCDLIRRCFASQRQVEAFTFGSVPLRTYLPDGDIDISMFFPLHGPADPLKDTWGTQLLKALEREAGRRDTPFRIRNCQIIQAEFKLVKFVVADVVVDVSFNALGGLCTVAFLEWADHTIGRNHLFKRSIVLVKAWCYYESRLLGAHHGLISSYALEAMVLYVFNLHGTALKSPLEVLHRFLKELGAFKWEKYALSLLGPIDLESLPHPRLAKEAMPPGPSLIDPHALRDAVQRYSVQPVLAAAALDALLASLKEEDKEERDSLAEEKQRLQEPVTIALPRKYLNIMDPLLPTNNLGRSVSKTSYSRIKKALDFGARQLDEILKLEPLAASEGITAYFENTWRSPTRMAADNQVFQSRLAMGGGAARMHGASSSNHRRRNSHGGGGGGLGVVSSVGSGIPRSFSRKLSTTSLPDIAASDRSASSAGERGTEEGAGGGGGASTSAAAGASGSGNKPPLPPPAATTNGASSTVPHTNATPPLSPRSGTGSLGKVSNHSTAAPATVSSYHQAAWATMNGHAAASGGYVMVPVVAGDGRRSFHASLPTSPVLTAGQMMSLQPVQMHQSTLSSSGQQYHSHQQHTISVVPHISTSSDIFMADLDTVMANLEVAREWQQPRPVPVSGGTAAPAGDVGEKGEEESKQQHSTTQGGTSTTTAGVMTTTAAATAAAGGKRNQNRQQPPQQVSSNGALEAAMAALPHLRVSAPVADSYATVTAQGLTPLTVPNSQAASGAASAASSAANTPRATPGGNILPASTAAVTAGTTTSISVGSGGTVPSVMKPTGGEGGAPSSSSLQPPSGQLTGKPPLPGGRSAPGSGTSTPKTVPQQQQKSNSGTTTPAGISGMPQRPWGRGAGGTSGATTTTTTTAAAAIASSAPGVKSAPLQGSTGPVTGTTLGPTTAAGVGGGDGVWSSIVASRQPSRLGQMHGSSIPATAITTGAASSGASVTEQKVDQAPSTSVAPPPIVVVAEDTKEWPTFHESKVAVDPGKFNKQQQQPVSAPASGVWGSLPASIRSGASTPAGNSPRAGSWAAAAAAPVPVVAASPKKTSSVVSSSPRKGASPAASRSRRRNSNRTSPDAGVGAKEKKMKEVKEQKDEEFNLRNSEFPTL